MTAGNRRLLTVVAVLVSLLGLMGLGGYQALRWVEARLQPVMPGASEPVLVSIPQGVSTAQVAELLRRKGLVKNSTVFSYYTRYRKLDSQLQGGDYELTKGLSVDEILSRLTRGQVVVRRFTVPEGLTVAETAALLAEKGLVSKSRFLLVAQASTLASAYLPDPKEVPLKQPLEGYLYPSTYDYKPGITETQVLEMMFAGFERVWTPEFRRRAEELKLSIHQVMTLASIIEKEAQVAAERPVISGVYHNRLKVGMKLDADPTVRFALGKPPQEPLLYTDLEVESPYNTYRNAGLPPGPIAAPGKESIRAALYPKEHDLWYFVAKEDGSGEHYFSETLQQHEAFTAQAAANLEQKK